MKRNNKEKINKDSHTPHNFYWKYTLIFFKKECISYYRKYTLIGKNT